MTRLIIAKIFIGVFQVAVPQSCRNDIGGNNTNYPDAAFMPLQICEAVPLSIGMEVRGNQVLIAIPRNTPYPYRVRTFLRLTVVTSSIVI